MSETSPYLSTAQAAEALGVGISTVKRWVDQGVLPAHRTAGGHRKLLRAEVLALARTGDLPRDDLAVIAVPGKRRRTTDAETIANAVFEAILAGDAEQVRALLRRAYQAGMPVEMLADGIRPLKRRRRPRGSADDTAIVVLRFGVPAESDEWVPDQGVADRSVSV